MYRRSQLIITYIYIYIHINMVIYIYRMYRHIFVIKRKKSYSSEAIYCPALLQDSRWDGSGVS